MSDLEAQLRAALAQRVAEREAEGLPELAGAAAAAGLVDVAYAIEPSPVGELLLASTPRGLVRIAYLGDGGQDADADAVLAELAAGVSPRVLAAPARLDPVRRELDEFFAGARQTFDLALDWRLTGAGFAGRVLRATARIPYGSVAATKRSRPRPAAPGPSGRPGPRSAATRSRSSSPATGSCTRAGGWAATPAGSSASGRSSGSRARSKSLTGSSWTKSLDRAGARRTRPRVRRAPRG